MKRRLILLFIAYSCCNVTISLGLLEDSLSPADILPNCVFGVNNVTFYVFNRDTPDGKVVDLDTPDIPVKRSYPTTMVVHGYLAYANASNFIELARAILFLFDCNVIIVDWSGGACTTGGLTLLQYLSYPAAAINTKIVGKEVALFVIRLINEFKICLANVTLIGHSLGSHVVGFAAKNLQENGTGNVSFILGLDPAGPGFEGNPCSERLCSTDGNIVQVFHTSYAFGMHWQVGHIDFYMHEGDRQPGCTQIQSQSTCSHSSAVYYLTKILRYPECQFIGRLWTSPFLLPPTEPCTDETCSYPGFRAFSLPARGVFDVDPTILPNYCYFFE